MPIHRLIIENKLHRYLTKDEVVHHKNEIKTDNRINNLLVMTKSEHRKYHSKDNLYKKGYLKYSDKKDFILELRDKGYFAKEISEMLNIPRRTIQRYCKSINKDVRNIRCIRNKKGQYLKTRPLVILNNNFINHNDGRV